MCWVLDFSRKWEELETQEEHRTVDISIWSEERETVVSPRTENIVINTD